MTRWGRTSVQDQETWLRDIKAFGVNLTTWEETFIERVEDKLKVGLSLTEKEATKLEEIYSERTP